MIETALGQLLLIAPVWPLLLALAAAFAVTRPLALGLLPWAALPGLITALMPGTELQLDGVMLGSALVLDATGRVFLLLISVLWLVTGLIARPRLQSADSGSLPIFLLLAMAGCLGMALAGDALLFFAAATVAGYALYGVLMQGADAPTRQAGTVLVVLLVISDLLVFEVLLLLGHVAGGFDFGAMREAFLGAGNRGLLLGLLVAGFGIKVGLVGLHFWLAPIFVSTGVAFRAALIAYMFGAGLLGGLRLLPLGDWTAPGAAASLWWLTWLTLAYACLVGALQAHCRSTLAYAALALGGLWLGLLSALLDQPQLWLEAANPLAAVVLQSGFALAALLLLASAGAATDALRPAALRWLAVLLLAAAPAGIVALIPDPVAAAPIYAAMAVIAFLAASSVLRNTTAVKVPGSVNTLSSAELAQRDLQSPTSMAMAMGLTLAAGLALGYQLPGWLLAPTAFAGLMVLLPMLLAIASVKSGISRLPSLPPGDVLVCIRPGLAWARRSGQTLLGGSLAQWPDNARALARRLWMGASRVPLGQWESALNRWPGALVLLLLLGLLLAWMGRL
jgi:formate hydrogenlyase subunit 3/multisubunit Na+/H+ antiporter MnhD subunit